MLLVDLIYPRRCVVCDEVLSPGRLVCACCEPKLGVIKGPRCYKCGKNLPDDNMEYCSDCREKRHVYDAGAALYDYPSISKSIYKFKYSNRPEYSKYLGIEMAKHLGPRILSWNPDLIIPVPLHKSKIQKRGYNQAALLAKEVARCLDISYSDKLVERRLKTTPMKELTASERQINLKNAFIVRVNDVKLNKVVIVDDIYTTGSTIDAIASELKEAGVKKVFFIALSIGTGI